MHKIFPWSQTLSVLVGFPKPPPLKRPGSATNTCTRAPYDLLSWWWEWWEFLFVTTGELGSSRHETEANACHVEGRRRGYDSSGRPQRGRDSAQPVYPIFRRSHLRQCMQFINTRRIVAFAFGVLYASDTSTSLLDYHYVFMKTKIWNIDTSLVLFNIACCCLVSLDNFSCLSSSYTFFNQSIYRNITFNIKSNKNF